ncbi:MAG: type II CAAX endopeptidase family protein [Verrucomicrobiales bacterium]|nr:type II CAAX endopeptidase family protein [Verrucomicrobiales bacterium]
MLPIQGWSAGAVVRLATSLFVCQLLGTVALALIRCWQGSGAARVGWSVAAALAGAAFGVATLVLLHPSRARPVDTDGESPLPLRRGWLVATLGCLYAAMVLAGLAQQFAPKGEVSLTTRTVLAAVCFQGAALILVRGFVGEHGVSWREAFGLGHRAAGALGRGALAAALFLPVAQLLQFVSAALMIRFNVQPEVQPAVEALRESAAWLDRMLMGMVAVVLAPLAEEILFRGILYPALKGAGFRRLAWWGTALLFAVVHWNVATFLPLLLFALVLTWLYERTGNLLAPVAAHALFNALNFAMFYVAESAVSG